MDSWINFVNEGSKDPCGFSYKISCNKVKTQTAIESVRKENGYNIMARNSRNTTKQPI